jgi:hypothetical protein
VKKQSFILLMLPAALRTAAYPCLSIVLLKTDAAVSSMDLINF